MQPRIEAVPPSGEKLILQQHLYVWKWKSFINYHFLCLAEIDVFLVLTSWLAVLNVHDADERHGTASQEEDSEEHNNDGGGADKLPFLNGLQAQMKAQSVRNSSSQT